ncbi:MAG: RNA methyltransferase [Ruminococcaceae bacterium]|nr:RNA methyltransferase [Oscillospiraceae bacterium]
MIKEQEKFADSNLLEGMVSIRAVLEMQASSHNDRRIIEILYAEERVPSHGKELAWLAHRADEFGFTITQAPMETLDTMAIGSSHGGVIARTSTRTLPSLTADTVAALPRDGFFVMLEGIEDPYNFGYAMRSLYAAGVDAIILPKRNWMSAAGVVCRASAGASERFPMYVAEDGCDAVTLLRAHGCRILCADIENSVSVYDAELTRPLFLIVGGEKRGISRKVLEMADAVVRLDYGRPFDGALSAASAASILAFEVYRQNRG